MRMKYTLIYMLKHETVQISESMLGSIYTVAPLSTYQVIFRFGHIGVIGPQFCLVDLKGSLIIILYFFVFPLVLAQ